MSTRSPSASVVARTQRRRPPARLLAASGLVAALLAAPALGQNIYNEVEPNDTKYTANGPFVMAVGDMIVGVTTGSATTPGLTSADNFLVKTTPAPLGIYQHRLVVTTPGTVGHTATIRGLTQTSGAINAGSDAVVQTSSTATSPPRFIQWYGFGKQEELYVRITGTTSTASDYTATLETIPVTPIHIGTYYNGNITIDRPAGNTADIDFWVYDANLNAIPTYGNDTPNILTRFYAPGTYYIAYTNWNFANDQPAAPDEGFLSGIVTDFPNVAVNNSTTLLPTLAIRMTDAFDVVSIPTPKNNAFEVVWLQFTVVDTPPVTGACCLPDGLCLQATASGCAGAGGVYSGDNTLCGVVACPQPGACCLPNYSCNILSAAQCAAAGGTFLGESTLCGSCPPPPAGVFPEIEPNDSKAQATIVSPMADGNQILGITTGSSTTVPGIGSADYFLIGTQQAPAAVYRHRLTLNAGGTTAHAMSIRGLPQNAATAGTWPCSTTGSAGVTDTSLQTSIIPSGTSTRRVQWYGFGKEERIYLRIDGAAATNTNYVATLETTPAPVLDIGDFAPGQITITAVNQGHSTDTDMWVYDANFNAIPGYGNDDASPNGGAPGTSLQGWLRRDYTPGVYYIAYASYNLANDQPSACDDNFRTGALTDFPNSLLTTSTAANVNTGFSITDANGSTPIPAVRQEIFDVLFFRFTVGGGTPPCPADWNNDGSVNSSDLSAFITSWLNSVQNGNLIADFNNDGFVNSSDLSAFITAWLAAVQNGC